MKKVLSFVLLSVIVVSFTAPSIVSAEESSVESVRSSDLSNSADAFGKIKSFVDKKVSFDGSKYVLKDPGEVELFLIQNERQISLETNSTFSGKSYFDYINKNIEDMNIKLNSGMYYPTADKGITRYIVSSRQPVKEKPIEFSSHWWGIKYQSFGPNGTIDLKKQFLNTALMEGAIATALGLTPAAVLSTFPIFLAAYDGMIANSIDGEIQKGTHNKGIQVDINNWVPHYAVYAN